MKWLDIEETKNGEICAKDQLKIETKKRLHMSSFGKAHF